VARLQAARERCGHARDARAERTLARIDGERMVHDVEAALAAAAVDPDAADKCASRLLDLKSALDELEDALAWPTLVTEAKKEIEVERKIVGDPEFKATAEERAAFANLEREIHAAIQSGEPDQLRGKVREMDRLGILIVVRHPGWWMGQLRRLEEKRGQMTDPAQADQLAAQARRAMNNNDFEALKAAVRQLAGLLPAGDADRAKVMSSLIQ
jgi:molecular chaperone DnaK